MKDRFSTDEWNLLKKLPMLVYGLVASADGVIDDQEIEQLKHDIATREFLKNDLHRHLLAELLDLDSSAVFKVAAAMTADEMDATKRLLLDKLSLDEYQRFMASLFIYGIRVARASGSGPLGLANPICQEERDALKDFANLFEVDMDRLSEHFG